MIVSSCRAARKGAATGLPSRGPAGSIAAHPTQTVMADDPDVSTSTRRDFLKAAGAGATIALLGGSRTAAAR
jgi:hypothetical protein